ncbi:hypothetical protein P8A11_14500, partial [Staphylococcus aureus]|uniref:hypothetical protein n=1 Tax=Staphylococcus aureus TaxID=1280 RepID=UPI003D9C02F8|nr:hypothetical protein [Staphylococcus aureus]
YVSQLREQRHDKMVVSYIFLTLQQNLSKGLVTLPLHNRLSINDVKRVCTIISKSIQEWREQ